jgi:hypothetical protein
MKECHVLKEFQCEHFQRLVNLLLMLFSLQNIDVQWGQTLQILCQWVLQERLEHRNGALDPLERVRNM